MDNKIQKIIVSGIIKNKNQEVLLAQRPLHKKIAPGIYHIPGGHVEFGETPEQAIVREIFEEFGLNVAPIKVVRTFSYIVDNIHTVGINFSLNVNSDICNIKFNQQDTQSIAWVNKNDVGTYLKNNDNDYVTLKKFFEK